MSSTEMTTTTTSQEQKGSDKSTLIYNNVSKIYCSDATCDQIEENLYLGGINVATSESLVKEFEIERILSILSAPIDPNYKFKGIDYKYLCADDMANVDLLTHFADCIEYISDGLKNGEAVYVHCAAGVSRSSTIVIAFLMQKYSYTYSEAFQLVRSKRWIHPNAGFVRQLVLFEEMKYTLNANYKKFRRYLISIAFMSTRYVSPSKDDYFNKLSIAEAMTKDLDLGQLYECAKCNCGLFNEINVIKNENPEQNENPKQNEVKEPDIECEFIFIEPQKWMSKLFAKRNVAELDDGVVNCPKCDEGIGKFDFYIDTLYCNCPLHVKLDCLLIKIYGQKLTIQGNLQLRTPLTCNLLI